MRTYSIILAQVFPLTNEERATKAEQLNAIVIKQAIQAAHTKRTL